MTSTPISSKNINVGVRLSETARQRPDGIAVVIPLGRDSSGKREYRKVSFRELDEDSSLLAEGLVNMGVERGMRLALMVKPGYDFISLVFAMFKAGIVAVLIDPGMGRPSLLRCLQKIEPDGFVALPIVHALRKLFAGRFPKSRFNVTVGRRWFWGGPTIAQLRHRTMGNFQPAVTDEKDPAAIIFTTGSTGPPKGVLYNHGNFSNQVDEIKDYYRIEPGEIDLSGFPLFALFNCAMGVTTIVPDMDFTRPADVNPVNIVEAVNDLQATQSFGSPALWNSVGQYCEKNNLTMPTLRRVLSAGAPVPPHVLQKIRNAIAPDGDVYTPYGATESLPVASISATEVLGETAAESRQGAGTCVGNKFPGIDWKVIKPSDHSISSINDVVELNTGEIGELIVRGGVVTRKYVTSEEANALHKITDGEDIWHRIGDVGYFDSKERFWFCGRKAHRVMTPSQTMFPIRCEAIFNQHASVYRSALVGVGKAGQQRPVIVVELWPDKKKMTSSERNRLFEELLELGKSNVLTSEIEDVLLHDSLPVDIRHNAKIFREKLAVWAAGKLK